MRGARVSVAAALVVFVVLVLSPPAWALTRKQAEAAALAVLRPQAAGRYAVVYGYPSVLPAGTTVSAAGPGPGQRWRVVRTSKGVELTARVPRTTLRGPGWLFWEDAHAGAEFPHPSRLLLLDGATGRVVWTRTIDWYPLVNDHTAAFYRSYRNKSYQVFARGAAVVHALRLPPAAASARAAPAAYKDACVVTVYDTSPNNDGANFEGDNLAILKLAGEYGFGGTIDKSGTADSAATLDAEVGRLVGKGCKDVVVLVAGHGAPAEGPGATAEPTVVIESHVAPTAAGGPELVIDKAITLSDLQALVRKYKAKADFKFVIDSCFSGRFATPLGDEDGVRFVGTSSQATELSIMSTSQDSPSDHVDGSNLYVSGLVTEFRKILDGHEENVDQQAVQFAKDDLVFALTLAADHAGLPNTGTDKAAARGLTHPSVIGNKASPTPPPATGQNFEYRFGPMTAAFTDDFGGAHTASIVGGSACGTSPLTGPWTIVHTVDASPTITTKVDVSNTDQVTVTALQTLNNDPARTVKGDLKLVFTLIPGKPPGVDLREEPSGAYVPGGITNGTQPITATPLPAGQSCP